MKLRLLNTEEHGKTRELWEKVFPEDTKAFLDYYYFIKTRSNQIYVIEEDEKIVSMLQLNPYQIRIEGQTFPGNYIIAVATEKEYRGRGYMRALLIRSLNDMFGQKIPFTFLMPAAEAIYTPYDFRFIYDQVKGKLQKEDGGAAAPCDASYQTADAGLWDAEAMAQFFHDGFEDRWQVYAVRDAGYYQTMIMEQQSERGGVRLLKKDGRIAGMAAYAREEATEIREPLCLDGCEEMMRAVLKDLARDGQESVPVYGDSFCDFESAGKRETKPAIMARIVCLRTFLEALKVPEGTEMSCSFAVIDPVIPRNSRVWKLESGKEEEAVHVRETEDSEGVLPVAELTELLFGRVRPGELKGREGVILSGRLEAELGKIRKLTKVFLNEVV